jgi:hypothetical protein
LPIRVAVDADPGDQHSRQQQPESKCDNWRQAIGIAQETMLKNVKKVTSWSASRARSGAFRAPVHHCCSPSATEAQRALGRVEELTGLTSEPILEEVTNRFTASHFVTRLTCSLTPSVTRQLTPSEPDRQPGREPGPEPSGLR